MQPDARKRSRALDFAASPATAATKPERLGAIVAVRSKQLTQRKGQQRLRYSRAWFGQG